MARYTGSTQDAGAPILGGQFFKKGIYLSGRILRPFETVNGTCYQIELDKELTVDGAQVSPQQKGKITGHQFSFGALKGIGMAIQAAGLDSLKSGDKVTLTCIGTTPTDKGSPMINFTIDIDR